MYYKHGTPLEAQLARIPEENQEERARVLRDVWHELKGTRAFDLLTLTLRDLEWEALQHIKNQPTKRHVVASVTMHVVDTIRRRFEGLGRMESDEATEPVDWSDDVAFWDLDESATARGEIDAGTD